MGNVFTFIQYRTYDICPGPVFRCEFNGGVHFAIRLTIFGNFSQCAIYIPLGPIFQCEFNCNSYYVIRRLYFHMVIFRHHFSMWIQPCYICNLWLDWEMCLLLFNMGHMIYVLDQFFDVNSMVMSVLWSEWPYMAIAANT